MDFKIARKPLSKEKKQDVFRAFNKIKEKNGKQLQKPNLWNLNFEEIPPIIITLTESDSETEEEFDSEILEYSSE